jgi:hypothetical protein
MPGGAAVSAAAGRSAREDVMGGIAGWLLLASVGAAGPPPPEGACLLLTRASVGEIQEAPVVSEKETSAKTGEVERRSCFFETDPFAKSVSLEWTREIEPGAARRRWNRTFHESRGRDEESDKGETGGDGNEHDRPPKPPERISGIGEEAFWVASPASGAFYAISDGSSVRVSVGGPGGAAEKRERSKKLAREALKAVPNPMKHPSSRETTRTKPQARFRSDRRSESGALPGRRTSA